MLTGRKLLVIGASSGMGRESAIAMARGGADVVFAARRLEAMEDAIREAGSGHAIAIDVTDPDALRAGIDDAARHLGGLDGLLFTPGLSYIERLATMSPSQWQTTLAVNLVGPNLAIAAALQHLSPEGVIAVVSSDSADQPRHSLVPYAASKAALQATMEGWRTEETGGRRFVTIVLGPTRPSEFRRDFDPEKFDALQPHWRRQGFRIGGLAASEVGAFLAQKFAFFLDNPGFGIDSLLLRAPEPEEVTVDFGGKPLTADRST